MRNALEEQLRKKGPKTNVGQLLKNEYFETEYSFFSRAKQRKEDCVVRVASSRRSSFLSPAQLFLLFAFVFHSSCCLLLMLRVAKLGRVCGLVRTFVEA